jgi:ketosteroid isomerase-like protein
MVKGATSMTRSGEPDTASSQEETKAVVERFYDASLKADLVAMADIVADDVVIIEAPSLPYGGTHSGREQALALLSQLYDGIDLDAIPRPEVLAGPQRAVAFVEVAFRGADGGLTVISVVETFRVRDGRIVEIKPYYFDTAAMAASALSADQS